MGVMNNYSYQLKPDAIIRSLRSAFLVPRDYSSAMQRLTNTINRLPKGQLRITHTHNGIYFYLDRKYLRKDSSLLYSLARKRYCETLLQVIAIHVQRPAPNSAAYPKYASRREKAFRKLEQLIRNYAEGNLQLDRIILTSQQYAWYRGSYKKKFFDKNQMKMELTIPQGDPVRSKSEQNIGKELHNFAVPCHYEEQLRIDVQRLVRSLEMELRERKQFLGPLFTYQGYSCIWNVPDELSWMNAPSSIWRSYDFRTGCLRIHPDYTIMLADGSLLYWEHEGLLHQFYYRVNSMERIAIMHQAGEIPKGQIIETNEHQANEPELLYDIIRSQILPRLWF